MSRYQKMLRRRDFIRLASVAGAGLSILPLVANAGKMNMENADLRAGKRIGIIGLDTSHSEVFTRMINTGEVGDGYRVVAAYPHGSPDIPSALQMKPAITEAVMSMGVEIVDSIEKLLERHNPFSYFHST